LNLPSIYKEREHNPVPERYKKHIGKQAISYSTYNSFIEDGYRGSWFANKFLKLPSEGNIFTEYGSSVGNYQETGIIQPYLSDFDMSVLDKEYPANPNAEYEREVLIDMGEYVIYGFVDRILGMETGELDIDDFKSGSIDKKASEYASEDYGQTTLYAHGLKLEGYKIKSSGVVLFDRKGNTLEEGHHNQLRLTGEIEKIDTPYSEERAKKLLKKIDDVAKQISDYYTLYQKIFVK